MALEQIARAVELGLGAHGPSDIELVTNDPDSRAYADQIRRVLDDLLMHRMGGMTQ